MKLSELRQQGLEFNQRVTLAGGIEKLEAQLSQIEASQIEESKEALDRFSNLLDYLKKNEDKEKYEGEDAETEFGKLKLAIEPLLKLAESSSARKLAEPSSARKLAESSSARWSWKMVVATVVTGVVVIPAILSLTWLVKKIASKVMPKRVDAPRAFGEFFSSAYSRSTAVAAVPPADDSILPAKLSSSLGDADGEKGRNTLADEPAQEKSGWFSAFWPSKPSSSAAPVKPEVKPQTQEVTPQTEVNSSGRSSPALHG